MIRTHLWSHMSKIRNESAENIVTLSLITIGWKDDVMFMLSFACMRGFCMTDLKVAVPISLIKLVPTCR